MLLKCIPLTFIGTSETKLQIGSNFENNRYTKGGVTFAVTNSTVTITNNFIGQLKIGYDANGETSRAYSGGVAVGYAYLIFDLQGA